MITRASLTLKSEGRMPCLIHAGQLLHEGPYQFAGLSGSIVRFRSDAGFDVRQGVVFARGRADLGNSAAF